MLDKIDSSKKYWIIYNKWFPYITSFVFLVLSILLVINHEYWRDEVRSWHIASESASITELFEVTRVAEGTPSLWYLILYFISHFVIENFEVMKILHIGVALATVFLILKFAPFNKTIKVMIVFGYYFFYEYSIISRNYALGILLIIIFCVLYKNKFKNIIPLGIILLLMGQVNTLAFILSVGLFIISMIEFARGLRNKNINKTKFYIFIVLFILEIIIFGWQIIPQIKSSAIFSLQGAANNFLISVTFKEIIRQLSINTVSAFLPVPRFTVEFWNRNIILDMLNIKIIFVLTIFLLTMPILILKRKTILLYVFCCIPMFTGFSLYKDSVRLLGFVFILFILCLWITNIDENDKLIFYKKTYFLRKLQSIYLLILLSVSLLGSSVSFYFDYKYPFSNGKNVAEYIIKKYNKDETVIVGYFAYAAETVAGYLDEDIYYPETKKFQRLLKWDEIEVLDEIKLDNIMNFKKLNSDFNGPVLIIFNQKAIQNKKINFENLTLIKKFENAIEPSENFYLYLIEEEK